MQSVENLRLYAIYAPHGDTLTGIIGLIFNLNATA